MRVTFSAIAITSLVLTGCGGSGGGAVIPPPEKNQPVDYSQLKVTVPTTEGLALADEASVKQAIANGLRLQLSGNNYYRGDIAVALPAPAPATDAAPVGSEKSGTGSGSFSETNVHVDGVDEADIAKYDGSHWFIANPPNYSTYSVVDQRPSIKIVATDPTKPNAAVVGNVTFDDAWGGVGDLYLVKDGQTTSHIASIRNQWGNVWPYLPGVPMRLQVEPAIAVAPSPGVIGKPSVGGFFGFFRPQNSQVRVQLFDVAKPSAPKQDWEIKLDGSLINSRKINNTLYLVTRFDPWLASLNYDSGDLAVRNANEQVIADAKVTDLMPSYYVGTSKTPLSSSCLLQANTKPNFGYNHLVSITAIDLVKRTVIGSTCVNSGVEALSMSNNNLYLTGTTYSELSSGQRTVVHKFNLSEQGAKYVASGWVTGSLGWNSDPAFRMHEASDQFRIVTSEWKGTGPEHKLTILRDGNNGKLNTLSTLPNDASPAPIGKPGEDIYSVRFQGDTAYIVTFRRTDPLYAIDLSDPLSPHITGELKIPGFATYMHPLPNNYLFTLGQDADANGRALGLKAELLKVVAGQPVVVNTVLIGAVGSQSEALQNLKALSVVNVSDDQVRFAFPVQVYGANYVWQYSGLQLLQVEGLLGGRGQLVNQGALVVDRFSPTHTYPMGNGVSRGILHDEAVFLSYNSAIWAAFWSTPKDLIGPIVRPKPEGLICTTVYVYGINATVIAPKGVDPCTAKVSSVDQNGHTELLMPINSSRNGDRCQFNGAGERGGSFYVTANFPGMDAAATNVLVLSEECHVIPVAIELQPTPVNSSGLCGGFAGFQCKTGYICVDDPTDMCDPLSGGADCSGVCVVPRPVVF